MTVFNPESFEPQSLTEREDAQDIPLISLEEARELVKTILVELSGSEIHYTEEIASVEADSIVSHWLAGDGVNLF